VANYSASHVKLTALPSPVREGSWWVHSWIITTPVPCPDDDFDLPAPFVGSEGMTIVVVRIVEGSIVLKVFEERDVISPGALVFASQFANLVRDRCGPGVAVNGDIENPLFLIVRSGGL
jgi:hypothetical protein